MRAFSRTVTNGRRFNCEESGLMRLATILICGLLAGAFAGSPTPPIRLVDAHTAGIIPRGSYQVESRLYPGGSGANGAGLLVGITAGITDRFNLGLEYGGEGIVGRGKKADFNPFPGCLVKYRLFDENFLFPGVVAGFDNQGYGGIAKEVIFGYNGYLYKSPGFFLAVSKSYLFMRTIQLGLHGDIAFSMEDLDHVTWPNVVTGLDIGITDMLSFVAEYDWGLTTKDPTVTSPNPPYARPQDGYLHAGVRLLLGPGFAVELDARDITENRRAATHTIGWSREIKVVYTTQI
jgi:hypothetical protein